MIQEEVKDWSTTRVDCERCSKTICIDFFSDKEKWLMNIMLILCKECKSKVIKKDEKSKVVL